MLSQDSTNSIENDDISFVYYDKESQAMRYLPNIYVKSKKSGILYPLKRVREKLYIRKSDGKLFDENLSKQQTDRFAIQEVERVKLVTDEFDLEI